MGKNRYYILFVIIVLWKDNYHIPQKIESLFSSEIFLNSYMLWV